LLQIAIALLSTGEAAKEEAIAYEENLILQFIII
jgi:hypothetical protein